MRKLIEEELQNYRVLIMILMLIALAFFVIFAIWGGEEIENSQPGVMSLLWSLSVVFISVMIMDRSKDRRDRIFALLPVSLRAAAAAKIVVFLIFWIVLFSGFWITHLIFHFHLFEWETLWGMLSLSGIVLSIGAVFSLGRDLGFALPRRKKWLGIYPADMFSVLFIFILFALFFSFALRRTFFSPPLRADMERFFSSPAGAAVFLGVCVVLILTDIQIFASRKSYTH